MVSTTRRSAGRAPDERAPRHERFARAVDGVDGALSDHVAERDLAVVAALRDAGTAAAPRPDEIDRMRRRVMAGFVGAGIADQTGTEPTPGSRVAPLTLVGSRRSPSHRRSLVGAEAGGRLVVAAAAALCLFLSLSGMSLLLSRDALPGDALYGFKRSAESAELGLTFGPESRGLKHLEFATSRVDEIEVLAAGGAMTDDSMSQVRAVLDDFDADTAAGARLLTTVAASGERDVLSALLGWIEQQRDRLEALRVVLPEDAGSRVYSSLDLLARLQERVEAVERRTGCEAVISPSSDDLGPLPAEGRCVPSALNEASSMAPMPDGAPQAGQPAAPAVPPAPGTPPLPAVEQENQSEPGIDDVLRAPDPSQGPVRPGEGEQNSSPWIVLPLPLPELPPVLPDQPEVEPR